MAKRISLRDFQQSLSERLTRAGQGSQSGALLGVQSGHDRWLVELAEAGEVIPVPPLLDTPLTKPWYAGLANIRGMLYSVVDLAAFHGQPLTATNSQARLLLVGARYGINAALLTTRAAGLKRPEELRPVESASDPARPWAGDRFVDADGVEWTRLRVQALLASPTFLNIAL